VSTAFLQSTLFRLYPNQSQERLFRRTLGCCRFIYNFYLDFKLKEHKRYLDWIKSEVAPFSWKTRPTESELKRSYTWLSNPDSTALQQSRIDLETAFQRFFNGHSHRPRFHRKGRKESFRCVLRVEVDRHASSLRIGKNGWIKARGSFHKVAGKIKSITVRLIAGKWYASVLQEIESQLYYTPAAHKYEIVGVDVGITHPLTLAANSSYKHVGHVTQASLKRKELKRKRYQRQLARKQKGSNNQKNARLKVSRAYHNERNTRKDFVEKTSHLLTSLFRIVVFEDLSIRGMSKKGKRKQGLNRELLRMGFSSLVQRCQTKALQRGGQVILVNPRHTSQICSDCGHKDKSSRKSQAIFQCVSCGFQLNADLNAARNILQRGMLQ